MTFAFKTILPALAAATLFAASAQAAQTMSVPRFRSISLHAGGVATLRHGKTQRVTLIKGDPAIVRIEVDKNGTLDLSPCKLTHGCPRHNEFEVEVVTPAIAAIDVHSGGRLAATGAFPRQPNLSVSVHSGGRADLRAIPADNVKASVHSGGFAEVRAEKELSASVHSAGNVEYWGHPSVTSSVHSGGRIERGQ
jgi:hypothetical protein